jgi:hypothetical protein
MTLKVLEIRTWNNPCYRGFVSASHGYLYSSRSGQLWKCRIPGYKGGTLAVSAEPWLLDSSKSHGKVVWMKYDSRKKEFSAQGPRGGIVSYNEPGFDRESYTFATKNSKQYLLWRGNEYRITWTRASWYEIVLNNIAQ